MATAFVMLVKKLVWKYNDLSQEFKHERVLFKGAGAPRDPFGDQGSCVVCNTQSLFSSARQP